MKSMMVSGRIDMNNRSDFSEKCIGILTFPHSASHGAALQMYALYDAVLSLGERPKIINYYSTYMRHVRHTNSANVGTLRSLCYRTVRKVVHLRTIIGFHRFEEQMDHLPQRSFSDRACLKTIASDCSAVICGSDQVWNPDITNYDLSYFLDFCGSGTKRIAYAPSFGFTNFPAEYDAAITNELKQFDAISIRESQGREKVKKLIGKEPQIVLDPTFLVPREKWEALGIPCKTPARYILYYAINRSEEMVKFCKQLSEKTGLPIVVAGGNIISKIQSHGKSVQYVPDTDPLRWIYLVSNATYVVTNSFHGLSFSIIFRKNFFLDLSSRTNDRLEHLISMLGLERQIIRKGITTEAIDYKAADTILDSMVDSSFDYLRQALRDE